MLAEPLIFLFNLWAVILQCLAKHGLIRQFGFIRVYIAPNRYVCVCVCVLDHLE